MEDRSKTKLKMDEVFKERMCVVIALDSTFMKNGES
jgi:hypothetical protein